MKNDLKFSGKLPVVVSKTGDARDVFNPMNTTSCDISIVSNKILSDLYTKDKKEIKVKVEKISNSSTTTLFEGYMTPNTYSQHLSPNLDNIDMTCIDPIAVLKYIYIDDLFMKSKTISIGQLIASALAAVKIDINEIWIENTVLYDGNVKFADMNIQTSNFWDEGGDPSSVYDAVSDCLRLFGYKLSLINDKYVIYLAIADHTFASGYREFNQYIIEDGGTLSYMGTKVKTNLSMKFQHSEGNWTTIDDNPTMSIEDIYDIVESVASTKIPNFSYNAFDTVSSEDRDKYDAGDLNIQCNKIKGYNAKGELITDDEWYYIWNGVYLAPEFGLEVSGVNVNGYANINNAYEYLSGTTGHPNGYGGLLNFYGGERNLTGTGKDQVNERPIEVKECITVFAPDNGTVPEFLERSDLNFTLKTVLKDEEDDKTNGWYKEATLTKINPTASKLGVSKTGVTERVVYKQVYENITLSTDATRVFNLDISQSYSRTGINQRFDISTNSIVEDKVFDLVPQDDGENYIGDTAMINRGTAYTYPRTWQSNAITVNLDYFNKYKTSDTISQSGGDRLRILPVWDKRKVVIAITLPNGVRYQFNGKEWVINQDTTKNAFWLCKIMNNEKIFNSDFQYDCIQCSDGYIYALKEDGVSFMEDAVGRIVFNESNQKGTLKYDYFGKGDNAWMEHINDVGEGRLSIKLPNINSLNVLFECYIYNSNLLGMTGNNTNQVAYANTADTIRFNITGQAREVNDYGVESLKTLTQYMCDNYNKVEELSIAVNHLPLNATYIKAEHLQIDMSLTVPETNLGQMFGESDIRYQTSSRQRFKECYQTPDFKVNTKHQIVGQSDSYLMTGNAFADPDKFVLGSVSNKINCRPENYVLQGYHNYFSNIRRVYNRVLVPHKAGFSNFCTYIEVPDLPDTGNGRWLMVVADSNDVKTNRHTITAVEDYGLTVSEINNYVVIEIPRKSRNPLYDLPSVDKKK